MQARPPELEIVWREPDWYTTQGVVVQEMTDASTQTEIDGEEIDV